jgi:hypothetical protein
LIIRHADGQHVYCNDGNNVLIDFKGRVIDDFTPIDNTTAILMQEVPKGVIKCAHI